jgi:hypothetical protein
MSSTACVTRMTEEQGFSSFCGTEFVNPAPHADTKAPEVRFPNRLWLRPIGLEKRTSAAEAVQLQAIYGTAEAVPFVKSHFPIWLGPSPNAAAACPSFGSVPQALRVSQGFVCFPNCQASTGLSAPACSSHRIYSDDES